MKPILISSGEPAGIGPDICLALANTHLPLVILGDPEILKQRADLLQKNIRIDQYEPGGDVAFLPNRLWVYPVPCPTDITPGKLSVDAAGYVIQMLTLAAQLCLSGQAAALVTAPVHKAIINQAGIAFSGHTEFFAELSQRSTVVMLLVSEQLRVSLLTTHLPLQQVAAHITAERLTQHVEILQQTLQQQFGILQPRIKIAGLNPHAGEDGYLGMEEIQVISPAIQVLQKKRGGRFWALFSRYDVFKA